MKRSLLGLFMLAACLAASPARAESITVPADVGIGPAAYLISGKVADDQPLHFGLKFSVQAIIDQATIQAHKDRIPASYRKQAMHMSEIRISPSIFIPDSFFISPKIQHTGIYGVTWRPLSLGVPLIDTGAFRFRLSAGLLLTYAFLYSDLPELPNTHFLRPGLDVGADIEIAFSRSFLISLGWYSGFYVPQGFGTFGMGPLGDKATSDNLRQTMWHFGQAFLKLHFRFPYTTSL
jgi:hypothetical protein